MHLNWFVLSQLARAHCHSLQDDQRRDLEPRGFPDGLCGYTFSSERLHGQAFHTGTCTRSLFTHTRRLRVGAIWWQVLRTQPLARCWHWTVVHGVLHIRHRHLPHPNAMPFKSKRPTDCAWLSVYRVLVNERAHGHGDLWFHCLVDATCFFGLVFTSSLALPF